jgi:hypothetical protein
VVKRDSRVNFDRHDAYATLFAGSKNGVSVREFPGDTGEIGLASMVSSVHTATDVSGFYNGGRYRWGRLTSPAYEAVTCFDTLIPSWEVKTPAGSWVELEVWVRSDEVWGGWPKMGV